MPAAIYLGTETQGYNLDQQRFMCERWCERNNIVLGAEFQDRLQQCARECRRKGWLLVVATGRALGSNTDYVIRTLKDLDEASVRVVLVDDGYDTGTASGRIMARAVRMMCRIEPANLINTTFGALPRA